MPTVITRILEHIFRRELRRHLRIPCPSITASHRLRRGLFIEGKADKTRVALIGIILQRIVHNTTSTIGNEIVLTTSM